MIRCFVKNHDGLINKGSDDGFSAFKRFRNGLWAYAAKREIRIEVPHGRNESLALSHALRIRRRGGSTVAAVGGFFQADGNSWLVGFLGGNSFHDEDNRGDDAGPESAFVAFGCLHDRAGADDVAAHFVLL